MPPQWRKLGVKYNDIKPQNGARHIDQVTRVVTALLDRAGTVVGHAVNNEMQYLKDVPREQYQIHDAQRMDFSGTCGFKLQDVASAVLGRSIQSAEHSSIEDAQATMALYMLNRAKPPPADLYDSGVDRASDGVGGDEGASEVSSRGLATLSIRAAGPVDQALEAHRAAIPFWIANNTHRVAFLTSRDWPRVACSTAERRRGTIGVSAV